MKYVAMGKGSSSKQTNTVYYTENGGSTKKYPTFVTEFAEIFYAHPGYHRFLGSWSISGTGSSSIVLYQINYLNDGYLLLLKNSSTSAATVNVDLLTYALNNQFGLTYRRTL